MSCPTCGAPVCEIRCAETLAASCALGLCIRRFLDLTLLAVFSAETPPAPDTKPPSPPGTERK
jgi:hypothetical protein